jgi:hypothetical protein
MPTIKSYSIKILEYKQTKTVYIPVYHNIYHDGSGFRVRVMRNKIRTSKNFQSLKEAVKFRRKLVYQK